MGQGMQRINLEEFCSEVAAEVNLNLLFIQEGAGGITNLYLEKALESGGIFETESDGLCSPAVPQDSILREIQNCSGASVEMSRKILAAMQKVLKRYFVEDVHVKVGKPISIASFGEFEAKNQELSSFHLRYCDPALSDYNEFLLT